MVTSPSRIVSPLTLAVLLTIRSLVVATVSTNRTPVVVRPLFSICVDLIEVIVAMPEVTWLPMFAWMIVAIPVTVRSLVRILSEIRSSMVPELKSSVLPLTLPSLPKSGSSMFSTSMVPPMLTLPSMNTSPEKVARPTKVERPVTLRSWMVASVAMNVPVSISRARKSTM